MMTLRIQRFSFTFLAGIAAISCSKNTYHNTAEQTSPKPEIRLTTVRNGFDPNVIWTQAYVASLPGDPPTLLVTLSKKFTDGVDNYGDLYVCESTDLGAKWTDPRLVAERYADLDGVERAFSDVYPLYHEKTGTLLATGKVFLYNPANRPDPEIGRRAGYLTYDPQRKLWSSLKIVDFPDRDHSGSPLLNPTFGCIQRFDESDGTILIPFNYVREVVEGEEMNVSAVARCSFDGRTLSYLDHGRELTIEQGRGLYEPSLIKSNGRYFLTLRADHSAFVATSHDGQSFNPPQEWRFDDGTVLGSYNTQQHWLTQNGRLYLVYTRKGANNDHIFRHRAPLFMAEVDTQRMRVVRSTESIVIPERGARLGNFGVTRIDDTRHAISAAEHQRDLNPQYEADNSVFVSVIEWVE